MDYRLNTADAARNESVRRAIGRLIPLMSSEGWRVAVALGAITLTSAMSLLTPLVISHVVDTYIVAGDYPGVLRWSAILLGFFLVTLGASYVQSRTMGSVGRRILFKLRNTLFEKLQSLPVAFFNQNRSGDLISRINNDTDKLNQFFAQALVQFLANAFMMAGAAIFLLTLDVRLGLAALVPAVLVLVVTRLIAPWVKRTSFRSLQTLGGLSGEIQESLQNFKVIVAFNRLDYFRAKFAAANQANYRASITAGVASNIFIPLYGLAAALGTATVIVYGIVLVRDDALSIGVLIAFMLYANTFYQPLRQLAAIWSSLQLALAGLDRVSEVLAMETDLPVVPSPPVASGALLAFEDVTFRYPGMATDVIRHASFELERGKTYAFIGPTGGGKTTTASLMARLYDPTSGRVLLEGRDIRAYDPAERTERIGFILQEPYLFTGTVRDNILYGNRAAAEWSDERLLARLRELGLTALLDRFGEGLDTKVVATGEGMSLGQKQLIAFIRAALRNPDLLILDEATANIDTVTEQLLQAILRQLPAHTTRVVIAHRLNTIESADEIFFVNAGEVVRAGSMEHAVEMLHAGARQS
ncbi:MAG: ABC transporter ATP-binding protein [Bauldia sp.]|nr:ABC transporter ATP-binding protein [Bauldia sp.]